MDANFPTALEFVLSAEGGFSDDPHDPGGPTMEGIILTEFQTFTGNPKATAADLQLITPAQVADIYMTNYWSVVRGDALPHGVDLSVFDMAVNAGTSRSVKLLQSALGVTADGVIGPLTLAATLGLASATLLTRLYVGQVGFYRSLSTFQYFGKGWLNRCAARLAAASSLLPALPDAGKAYELVG